MRLRFVLAAGASWLLTRKRAGNFLLPLPSWLVAAGEEDVGGRSGGKKKRVGREVADRRIEGIRPLAPLEPPVWPTFPPTRSG